MARPPSFEAMLRWALLGLTLVAPCVLGFTTTYVLLLLALAALVWVLLPGQRARLRLDDMGRLTLLGWLILAIVISLDALVGGTPRDILYVFDFGMLLLYAPLAALYGKAANPRNGALIGDLALAGSVLAAAVALGEELLLHPERTGVIANDPIRFGDTALILGFLALIGTLAHSGPRRWIYLGGPVLAIFVDLMSGARSALVVFPVLAVLAAIFLIEGRRIALAIGTVVVVLFAGTLGIAVLLHNSRVESIIRLIRSTFGDGPMADEATRERLALYNAGIDALQQAPLLGVGWHRRMEAVTTKLPDADKALGGLPHLHNEVLNFAVGTGVVGVLAYALLLTAPLIAVLRSPRDSLFSARLYGVIILITSYFGLGLADVMLGFETHTALYVAWAAVLLAFCRDGSVAKAPAYVPSPGSSA